MTHASCVGHHVWETQQEPGSTPVGSALEYSHGLVVVVDERLEALARGRVPHPAGAWTASGGGRGVSGEGVGPAPKGQAAGDASLQVPIPRTRQNYGPVVVELDGRDGRRVGRQHAHTLACEPPPAESAATRARRAPPPPPHADSPFWTSQTLTVSSMPPLATKSSLGFHATQKTALRWPRRTLTLPSASGSSAGVSAAPDAVGWAGGALVRSQMRMVRSSEADARKAELFEKARCETPAEWALSERRWANEGSEWRWMGRSAAAGYQHRGKKG